VATAILAWEFKFDLRQAKLIHGAPVARDRNTSHKYVSKDSNGIPEKTDDRRPACSSGIALGRELHHWSTHRLLPKYRAD
jgi:hypothetical protein